MIRKSCLNPSLMLILQIPQPFSSTKLQLLAGAEWIPPCQRRLIIKMKLTWDNCWFPTSIHFPISKCYSAVFLSNLSLCISHISGSLYSLISDRFSESVMCSYHLLLQSPVGSAMGMWHNLNQWYAKRGLVGVLEELLSFSWGTAVKREKSCFSSSGHYNFI